MSEKSFGDKKDYVSSDSSEENRIRPRILNKGNKDNIVLNDESLEVNLSQPSPSLMSRIEKRPRNTSDDTDENNTEGFTLVERKRRSKRLNRSLSQNNLSDLTRMNNLSDFPRKNRVEPLQSIVQTCEDGEVCVTSKEDLPKQVGLAKLLRSDGIQNIQKITYKNSCKVLVRFNSKQDAEKLLQSKKISDLGYRCQLTTELNLTYGILRRIELDVTEEEIKNDFDCMYKIVSAKRLKRLDERGAWVDSETVRVCFQSSTLPPYVSAYGYGIKVELNYFPVTQCSGCWKFGHLLRVCPSKKKMCPKCGGAHDNCEATTFVCINCKGKHMALDKSCPSYQKERWIRAIMAEENCTYRIALQKVLSHKKDQETVHAVLKETDAVDEHIALPGTSSTLPTNYRDSVLKKATKQSPNTEIEMEQDGSESSEEESNLERNQKHVGTTKPKKVKGKKKNNTQKKARRDQDTDAESKDDCARLQTTPDQENIHRKKNLFSWALFLKKAKNIIVSDVSLEEKIKLGFKLIMEAITKFVFQIVSSENLLSNLSSVFSSFCNG
ncbi:uncharacterized protein LOC134746873 [Cydia strobilella]|uniref:uncharacterized protein LOC134746873 n=1 Tax=Cydia strobilella TaxID=1100964 RepID=UPI003007927D